MVISFVALASVFPRFGDKLSIHTTHKS